MIKWMCRYRECLKALDAFMADKVAYSIVGNPMGVASQILKHVFRAPKGRLGVDDPVLFRQWFQKRSKRRYWPQRLSSNGYIGQVGQTVKMFQNSQWRAMTVLLPRNPVL